MELSIGSMQVRVMAHDLVISLLLLFLCYDLTSFDIITGFMLFLHIINSVNHEFCIYCILYSPIIATYYLG